MLAGDNGYRRSTAFPLVPFVPQLSLIPVARALVQAMQSGATPFASGPLAWRLLMPPRNVAARQAFFPKEDAMADDLKERGQSDRDRINMSEDYEARYWSEKFGVSKERLKAAVDKVGPMARDVAHELGTSL